MQTAHLPGNFGSQKVGQSSNKPSAQTDLQILRSLNLKVTHQRLLILKCLNTGRAHITAQELFELVHQQDAGVGFATVYRLLKELTTAGFVTELRMGGSSARYEVAPQEHHDHLSCVQCGKICEFENSAIEELQEKVAAQFGFTLKSHILELFGVCRDCQITNSAS